MIYENLLDKIKRNDERIAILGMGYVGLPLAVTFALKKLKVTGFDPSVEKTDMINKGINYIGDVEDSELSQVVSDGSLIASSDFSRLDEFDIIIICVPTPLDKFKKPNMSYIERASNDIGRYMKKGTLVVLESTTYPTTTESLVLPIIEEKSGYQHGKDFWLAFSPERVDPGNARFKTENTPKVFGAMSQEGRTLGIAVYEKAITKIHPVSSPRVAEMVKILENTYRLVNISLINELALLAGRMEIDIWEVIEAAGTKPFGFQAFYPGPGIGGHCIPLDPFYLEYIAKNYNFDLTMINTAGHIDNMMPHRMMVKINFALNKHKIAINGAKILFLGVAYKEDIGDERESPALKIMDEVLRKGGEVSYYDPYVESIKTDSGHCLTGDDSLDVSSYDCIVVTTKHSVFNFNDIYSDAKIIVDLRNAYAKEDSKVYKL